MNAFLNHFSFEFRTGIRNRALLFMTYLFPLAVYLLIGALMTSVNPTFRDTMIPAMIIFAVMASTLLTIPATLVSARKEGIFRSYRINGVPALTVLIIPTISVMVHLIVVAALITISAPFVFKGPAPVNWPGFFAAFLLIYLACAALSLLIGVFSTSSQMTILWGQLIFLPSMILGGLMLPTSLLPKTMARISLLLPTTYGMRVFSGLAYTQSVDKGTLSSIIVLLAGALLAFGLALYLFTWDAPDTRQRKRMPLALLALLPFFVGALLLG